MTEARRRPNGETTEEILAERINELQAELDDLKAFANGNAAKKTGDTFTGKVDFVDAGITPETPESDTNILIQSANPQIEFISADMAAGSAGRRFWIRHHSNEGQLLFMIDENDDGTWNTPHPLAIHSDGFIFIGRRLSVGSDYFEVHPYSATYDDGTWLQSFYDGNNRRLAISGRDSNNNSVAVGVHMDGDLTVEGSKNAEIPDPDDETIAYRFAAVEADEPGLLMHRTLVTIPSGETSATTDLPEHWSRIAANADAMVSPVAGEATEQRDQRIMPHANVDITLPRVTVEGLPGDYRVWVLAQREDNMVSNWEHTVAIE